MNVEVQIVSATLSERQITPTQNLKVALLEVLDMKPAILPVNRLQVRTIALPEGSTEFNTMIAFDQQPTLVFAVMMNADAYNGAQHLNY